MMSHRLPTISVAHQWLMNELIWTHNEIVTEDGEKTWEMLSPVYVEISCPRDDRIHPKSSFQLQKCEEYADQLLNGTPNDFSYTYHERLFEYDINGVLINQVFKIIQKLKEQQNTRRAVAVTWNPEKDNKNHHVPCLQYLQFIIRRNRLDMICLFRSEDILQAFGPNAYGLVKLMEYVSEQVGVPVGTYTHIITVPHLYPIRDKADLQRWM